MRFRLLCVSAATFPNVMVMTARTQNNAVQSAETAGNPSTKIRINIANEAALDPTDRNAVTGVGAPSYTSGAHIWKGTAAILKPIPAPINTTASMSTTLGSCPLKAVAIPRRPVVPVAP